MANSISATYSAEDNKLRLYCEDRLDEKPFQTVKDAGFRWAPKQELFVAPAWSPGREDLCVELAGEITAEQSTMVERAADKAARLDGIAVKREQQLNSFHEAANLISERFAGGQPILIGHHSERKARKDQGRMHTAMSNAVKAHDAIQYWNWRADGVERHANRKSNPGVRLRRIQTLLKDLRAYQRQINHAKTCVALWTKTAAIIDDGERAKVALFWSGAHLKTGGGAGYRKDDESMWSLLDSGKIESDVAIARCLEIHQYHAESPNTLRWIAHTLNRLAYERAELGPVARFDGEITAVILKGFARTHGADKPRCAGIAGTCWVVESDVDLPTHLASSKALTLKDDEWCDLMQASGYEVPIVVRRKSSRPKPKPLINPTPDDAERLQALWNQNAQKRGGKNTLGGVKPTATRSLSQAHFSRNSKGDYSAFETIELDIDGNKVSMVWRNHERQLSAEPVCRIRVGPSGESVYSPNAVLILNDKPTKALPIEWVAA